MAVLAVRDAVFEEVAKIAKKRQLPVEDQVEEFLLISVVLAASLHDFGKLGTGFQDYLRDPKQPAGAKRRKLFETIAAMTPNGPEQIDSVVLLREDRDR